MAVVPETRTFWRSKDGIYTASGGIDVEGRLVWSLDDALQDPGDPPSVEMDIAEYVEFIAGLHELGKQLIRREMRP